MWVYVLEDLAGNPRSELPGAYGKTCAPQPLASMGTAGVTVPLDHEDADFLLAGDALLRVYETDVPGRTTPLTHFHGRLITAEEVAGSDNPKAGVACTFADGLWTLLRRLCGKSRAGYSAGTALALVDRGAIIADLVNTTNLESPSGIRPGQVLTSAPTFVSGWYYAKIAEKIAELSATLDGPDYMVRPIDFTSGYYCELDVAAVIGAVRLDSAFEFGDGLLNVKSYKRGVSLDGTANRVFHLPPGFPDNLTQEVKQADNAGSQATRGLLEDIVSADLSVDELRVKLVAHHIAVRSNPRQTITFEPVTDVGARVPRYGVDFANGDVVPFRATFWKRSGPVKRIDALFRIYQTAFAVDDNGVATPTLTITPS